MGIATQPSSQLTFSYLTRPASMSQGFHQQHHGLFSFSEGFDRASQEHPHHHIAQQSRRDKLRVQGFDVAGAGAGAHPLALIEEQGDDPSIFESTSVDGAAGSMLSDMFGFPAAPAGPSGVDQMQANYQLLPRPAAAMAGFSGDWYGPNRQIHQQPPQPDPAAAMQLFLMNPSSPSRTHQGFQSFGETPFGGRVVEGRGLSLSLSSSLQPLDHMAKAFHNQQPAQQPALHLQLQSHVQAGQVLHGHTQMNILRSSKYAKPAQELLEEFCSVGRGQLKGARAAGRRHGGSSTGNANPSGGGGSTSAAASTSSSKDVPPLSPADRFEHQRKRAKLISMLDEVERRYNHYCDQMQAVVNSFDTVMGFGAATPYTALAQKAMSRHFRCLKDVIAAQLKQTCELLGEKEGAIGSGVTKGETPRLRLLEQNLRQQRAFNQMGMMEQEAWRPQRGLPERSVSVLRGWLFEHFLHPYPSDADKHFLMRQTGLSRNQVSNWFINARVRLWKPMVEEMYLQESNEQGNGENEEKECSETNQSQQEEEEEQEEEQQQQESQRPETNAASESKASPIAPSVSHRNHRFASSSETPPPGSEVAHHSSGGVDDSILMFNADALAHMGDVYQHQYGQAGRLRLGAAGDVSLTLGLRHAGGGGAPEKSRFSVRDFSG